jgi:hypothetical protein
VNYPRIGHEFRGSRKSKGSCCVSRGAVIEANRGIYFPRAASKLVYRFCGSPGTLGDPDKSAAAESNERQSLFLSESEHADNNGSSSGAFCRPLCHYTGGITYFLFIISLLRVIAERYEIAQVWREARFMKNTLESRKEGSNRLNARNDGKQSASEKRWKHYPRRNYLRRFPTCDYFSCHS